MVVAVAEPRTLEPWDLRALDPEMGTPNVVCFGSQEFFLVERHSLGAALGEGDVWIFYGGYGGCGDEDGLWLCVWVLETTCHFVLAGSIAPTVKDRAHCCYCGLCGE